MVDFYYQYEEQTCRVQLEPQPDGTWTITLGDQTYQVELLRRLDGQYDLRIDGQRIQAYAASQKGKIQHTRVALAEREVSHYDLVRVQGEGKQRQRAGETGSHLSAQMPGQVMEVLAAEGDSVQQGQTILLLEAMKMELRLTSPVDGVLTRLHVQTGETVERGQQLAEVQPGERGTSTRLERDSR